MAESLFQSLAARARRGLVTGEATPADLAACSSLTANSPVGGPAPYSAFPHGPLVRYGSDCNVGSAIRSVQRCETRRTKHFSSKHLILHTHEPLLSHFYYLFFQHRPSISVSHFPCGFNHFTTSVSHVIHNF